MMEPWVTFEELCERWDLNKYNLASLFLSGEIMAYHPLDFSCIFKMQREFVREPPNREGMCGIGQPTVDDIATFLFDIDEVMRYEREKGIIPHIMAAYLLQQNATTDPDATQQSHNDEPLFPLQVWQEVKRFYDIVKKNGFKGPDLEKKLKVAAKKEFANNKKDYRVIKQRHLNCNDLYAVNTGKERRDFIGNLLQIITSKREQKKIGAQRLYAFGKQHYQNHD